MNSLLLKEGMGGSVQMAYVDPPYGIGYRSNFQPLLDRPGTYGDIDENLTREPETIRAFRDTWELGIHSYLSHLRDRLLLIRELLTESGSCFVQIGDENLDLVLGVCSEVFGRQNRVATITVAKTSGASSKTLPEVADYLVWFAKDKSKLKYHQLYEKLSRPEIVKLFSSYAMVEESGGEIRKLSPKEKLDPDRYLPRDARIFGRTIIDSQGTSTGRIGPFNWNGVKYPCPDGRHWSVSKVGMNRLQELNRLVSLPTSNRLMRKRYEDEVPGRTINNIWSSQKSAKNQKYVVETAPIIVQRCMLMTTDPGDLVLDPTCGSGTTAFVAEQWGRRWITCDTSRIALTLAKQRIITANYKYFELAYPEDGVASGFRYKKKGKSYYKNTCLR